MVVYYTHLPSPEQGKLVVHMRVAHLAVGSVVDGQLVALAVDLAVRMCYLRVIWCVG